MVVAVDARFLAYSKADDYSRFRKQLLLEAIKTLKHQIVLLVDRPIEENEYPAGSLLITGPKTNNSLTNKFWLDVRLPSLLKKIKADVFVGLNGQLSSRTKIPQVLLVNNLSRQRRQNPNNGEKGVASKDLKQASLVLSFSESLQTAIAEEQNLQPKNLIVLPPAVEDSYITLDWEGRANIKQRYTEDKEFFLYLSEQASIDEIQNLLKAFSFFKRRQQSGMKLILAGAPNDAGRLKELLATFKYRSDVVRLEEADENMPPSVIASAYALIQANNGFETSFLKAMKCGVPVLISENSLLKGYTKEAALYFKADAIGELAEQMMFIYKDENMRSQLIENGKQVSSELTWKQSIERFKEALEKVGK